MLGHLVPSLAKSRQVIAVDLQAHGRTADVERPMSFEAMAEDVAGLMKYLAIGKADVMGYSLGGAVALRLAIQNKGMLRKLVLVATVFARNGWYPEVLAGMAQVGAGSAEMMKPSPLYKTYARTAPRPQDFPVLLTKVGELLKNDYDWSPQVPGIEAQTMLVFADSDAIRPEHMVQFYQLLGGGKKDAGWNGAGQSRNRLAILPGLTHYNVFSSPALPPAVLPFLDARSE